MAIKKAIWDAVFWLSLIYLMLHVTISVEISNLGHHKAVIRLLGHIKLNEFNYKKFYRSNHLVYLPAIKRQICLAMETLKVGAFNCKGEV